MFRSISNTENGEVGSDTVFHYHQEGSTVWADYAGGEIRRGHLIGSMLEDGRLEFLYHHVNTAGELSAGRCTSRPEALSDGRLRFLETWQWMTGDESSGTSIIEEIAPDEAG